MAAAALPQPRTDQIEFECLAPSQPSPGERPCRSQRSAVTQRRGEKSTRWALSPLTARERSVLIPEVLLSRQPEHRGENSYSRRPQDLSRSLSITLGSPVVQMAAQSVQSVHTQCATSCPTGGVIAN